MNSYFYSRKILVNLYNRQPKPYLQHRGRGCEIMLNSEVASHFSGFGAGVES